MKKLIMAAVLAGSMVAVAEDAKSEAAAPAEAEKVVEAAKAEKAGGARRVGWNATARAQKQAELEKKSVEIIKKYGLDEEKAKALYKELQDLRKAPRASRQKGAAKPAPKAE